MTPQEQYNKTIGERTVEALKKRGFEAWYKANGEEALSFAMELIPKGASVSWGGSKTIEEMGLAKALSEGEYRVLDRSKAATPEERKAVYRQAFSVDWYLGSANALAMNGEIVNIDGTGNRVAAMMYGPDNVLLIVGVNKIAATREAAVERAKNVASPINAMRFGFDTPCTLTGSCVDCLQDNCICSYITLMRKCKPLGRIKVIIVGEELGY